MSEQTRPWTVAVYLAGGEGVSREMIPALHDMRDVALEHGESMRVLAQFDPDKRAPRIFAFDDELRSYFKLPIARARARASTPFGLANYEYVIETERPDGKPLTSMELLEGFLQTGQASAGDGHFMFVISGHGNGAVGEFLGYRNVDAPVHLPDLQAAFASCRASGPKIDVIGMDCCNMSMVEVAFELAPYARFLVASEGYILNHGWPYRPMLDAVVDLDPEAAGAEMVRQFVGAYSDYALVDVPSHAAVTDLEKIDRLTEPVRRLSESLMARIRDPDVWRPVVLAHWEAQSFKDEEYVDLADFCDRLRMHAGEPGIQSACGDVIDAVADVVKVSCFSGAAFQYSTGLSVYFPWCNDFVKSKEGGGGPSQLERYQSLTFSQKTRWGELIDGCLLATRRPPRSAEGARSLPGDESYRPLEITLEPAVAPTVRSLPTTSRPGDTESRSRLTNHSNHSNHSQAEREEVRMKVKRVPPWSAKGRTVPRPRVKNHPQGHEPEGLTVRRVPPWSAKGGAVAPVVRLKNHPK